MRKIMVLTLLACCIIVLLASPVPGGHKRVKHRIHVPTKIHTIFVTKFVKVPEHHHHHHTVKKEEHHHHHNNHKLDSDHHHNKHNYDMGDLENFEDSYGHDV